MDANPLGPIVYGLVLALLIWLARSRRLRAAQLLEANRRLAREIERRESAEKAARAADEELQAVVASFPDHVWSARIDADETFTPGYYSDLIGDITGRPSSYYREEPSRWIATVHEDDRERVRQAYEKCVGGDAGGFSLEYRIVRADGTTRWIRDRVRVTLPQGGTRLDGVMTDITAMKQAEEERARLDARFQQAQRLESLGVLAGGIAHDFNNLLVGVLGHARLALDTLPAGSAAREHLEKIERAARRAAELCRQMLAYAGKGAFEIAALDLRETVEELGELLAVSVSKKVSIHYDFGAEPLPAVEADASQIRQVILNLITNASEAIGEQGGVIRVTARRVHCQRADLDAALLGEQLKPGAYLSLTVADDGCGMDADTRHRFFEPFYSTKFVGRGLGMAAVLGIVRGHDGAIRVDSAPGEGTAITVLLPALGSEPLRREPPPLREATWRASGTLLLIDDEADAREVGATFLERAGFRVLTAADGVAGEAILREHADEVAGVLLDLTMPRLDGVEALEALRRVRPDLPVVLCSGYPRKEAMERFADLGFAGFLEKPYTPEALLATARSAFSAEE